MLTASKVQELTTAERDLLSDALRGRFRAEESGASLSPSSAYFWQRKRSEFVRLLRRNRNLLDDLPRLFVDAGCGDGLDLFTMRREMPDGWRYVGLDVDRDKLLCARMRCEYLEAPVEFVETDITARLPFEDGQVGVMFTSETIEHIPDPERYLGELRRVTAPGGLLFFSTPNQPNVLQRSWWSRPRREQRRRAVGRLAHHEAFGTFGHISLRKVGEWDQALRQAGFALVEPGRGALVEQRPALLDHEAILAGLFAAQALLDVVPRRVTRRLSATSVGLYQSS